jgi:mono/diheme cytochrome c family protein
MDQKHRALFHDYCISCHGPEKQKGKFRVDQLDYSITNLETAEKWQKVLNELNAGEMPPEDEKQPPNTMKADFLEELSHVMVAARRSLADRHGEITLRRLNRREDGNTLRELLGVDVDVTELPADTGTGGFDTVGSDLFMSGNQFEQYLEIGRDAMDEAFAWQTAAGQQQKIRIEAEETLKVIRKNYADKLDALDRATQWAKAVDAAAAKPENAGIVTELRKGAKNDDFFRRQWARIPGAPAPEEYGFKTVENNADKANGALSYGTKVGNGYMRPYEEAYLKMPHLDTGAYLNIQGGSVLTNENLTLNVPFAWKNFVGDYIFRVRIAATDNAPPERRFIEFGIHPRNGQVISTHQVKGTMDKPQIIEIPVTLTRRNIDNRELFIREKGSNDNYLQARAKFGEGRQKNGIGPNFVLWVDWMELERIPNSRQGKASAMAALGIPLDDQAKPTIPQVRAALGRFCAEAFRGVTPDADYLDRLTAIYQMRLKAGDKHSGALKQTLSVVLASPQFLYLAEPVQDEHTRPLSGLELATRLSYFLWGAPPDSTLRALAKNGELLHPEVLAAQTDRLLNDPRSRGFTRPFVHQWLGLDRLDFFQTNQDLYPRFDASTKLAAGQEVFETFEYLLRTGSSFRDLLKCDYAVVNPVLAQYYGLPEVSGDAFRKVALPKDSPRGGLLGMAAVLAMGGNGERTSPVERGAWVLRKLVDDPPPPAPANVPQIARLAGKVLTTRERLQAHQENAQCASCHRKIDPFGLGLENFDAVGQWRTEDTYQVKDEHGKPVKGAAKTWVIDASATLHKGPSFRDYFDLRDIIASRADNFARGFGKALIEYALGRPIGFRDEGLADEMIARAKKNNLSVREFIHGLVASNEFHTK